LKQLQQLKIAYPHMAIEGLGDSTNFSKLAKDETLYLVGHGDATDGNFRGVTRAELLTWLTRQQGGVPSNFGGIVIQSCYSGLQRKPPEPSLVEFVATGLAGKTASGTPVAGANGYSFGTPEFGKTRRSSVLPMDLDAFYSVQDITKMTDVWLQHKPTHDGGILKKELGIDVDTGKTIEAQLTAIQKSPDKTPKEIARQFVTTFAETARQIEKKLREITIDVPGYSASTIVGYMVDPNNSSKPEVDEWNKAVNLQYGLFGDHYLWAPTAGAFTVKNVK
jgi:hypothetical protein